MYPTSDSAHIAGTAGYYISPDVTNMQVITAGGGGDRVKYFPYKAIEPSYKVMLGTIFEKVVKLNSPRTIVTKFGSDIRYIVTPQIVTTSGSPSFITWPPTTFSVELTSNISDSHGKKIVSPKVIGIGSADFSEFIGDKGLAGKRAMRNALIKMQAALRDANIADHTSLDLVQSKHNNTSSQKLLGQSSDVSNRFRKLNELYQSGLITKQEYQTKRAKLLDGL